MLIKLKWLWHSLLYWLRPGAIVGAMPNLIANGTLEDAVPVMTNFNWIMAQVNANAAPLSNTPQLNVANTFTTLQSGIAATNAANFPVLGQLGSVLLASKTAAASATLDFTGLTGYAHYLFVLQNVVLATDAKAINVVASQDNGATWLTLANTYVTSIVERLTTGAAAVVFNDVGAAHCVFQVSNASNAAGKGVSGDITMYGLGSAAAYKYMLSKMAHYDGANLAFNEGLNAFVRDATPINAIRFIASAGNIATGTIKVYGFN
jgi:hypothetical protein